ncbi:MAG: 4Fe-4S ferredoxin [Spirochaetia bacterium]|nr:4Fe-4S ferredoxin [Spirochaetia bacterium]
MYAIRNISKCTKDCLCLFVCPTGATDTETGQIDPSRCIDGCRLCVDICPSGAISLMVENFPLRPKKDDEVISSLSELLDSKIAALEIVNGSTHQLMKALNQSLLILGEDCAREAGFMIPQDTRTIELLKSLVSCDDPQMPKDTIKKLLSMLT